MRPSCTATTDAFGALIRSTNWGASASTPALPVASAAASAGVGGAVDPGIACAEPATAGEPDGLAPADAGAPDSAGAPALATVAGLDPFAAGVAAAFAVALEDGMADSS